MQGIGRRRTKKRQRWARDLLPFSKSAPLASKGSHPARPQTRPGKRPSCMKLQRWEAAALALGKCLRLETRPFIWWVNTHWQRGGQRQDAVLADEVGEGKMQQCLRMICSQSSSPAVPSSPGASVCRRGRGQGQLEGVSSRARGEEQHQAKIITFCRPKNQAWISLFWKYFFRLGHSSVYSEVRQNTGDSKPALGIKYCKHKWSLAVAVQDSPNNTSVFLLLWHSIKVSLSWLSRYLKCL